MNDQDLNKIKRALKELIAPLKELVEIASNKVKRLETSNRVLQMSVDKIKDQQSVINEKLDEQTEILTKHSDKLDNHTVALMKIEDTLEGYADMYKVNKDDNERLEQRVEEIEARVGPTSQK